MGVLEYTGEQQLYIPDRDRAEPAFVLGERGDVPRAGYGMDYLRAAVQARDGWFTYGAPVDSFFVYQPELYIHAKLPADHMFEFWRDTMSYAPQEALAAVEAIREFGWTDLGSSQIIFEAPFEEWDTQTWPSQLADDLQRLLSAHREADLIRDDRQDAGGDPSNPHYTEIRQGFLGVTSVMLVTRSRVAYDEQGREVVTRLVELVKPDPQTVLKVLNQLSLTEHLRVLELLIRMPDVTDAEWDHAMSHADRSNMQRDHHSLMELIEQFHYVPETPRWRRVVQATGRLIGRIVDSPPVDRLERRVFKNRQVSSDF
ncbi:MAG TPA: hypothetical protein VL737_00120 [Candidatus Pristimantibacillus sp.]|nr:hypothetical protein [Candidatus Pristimantibacillus sp.]